MVDMVAIAPPLADDLRVIALLLDDPLNHSVIRERLGLYTSTSHEMLSP